MSGSSIEARSILLECSKNLTAVVLIALRETDAGAPCVNFKKALDRIRLRIEGHGDGFFGTEGDTTAAALALPLIDDCSLRPHLNCAGEAFLNATTAAGASICY